MSNNGNAIDPPLISRGASREVGDAAKLKLLIEDIEAKKSEMVTIRHDPSIAPEDCAEHLEVLIQEINELEDSFYAEMRVSTQKLEESLRLSEIGIPDTIMSKANAAAMQKASVETQRNMQRRQGGGASAFDDLPGLSVSNATVGTRGTLSAPNTPPRGESGEEPFLVPPLLHMGSSSAKRGTMPPPPVPYVRMRSGSGSFLLHLPTKDALHPNDIPTGPPRVRHSISNDGISDTASVVMPQRPALDGQGSFESVVEGTVDDKPQGGAWQRWKAALNIVDFGRFWQKKTQHSNHVSSLQASYQDSLAIKETDELRRLQSEIRSELIRLGGKKTLTEGDKARKLEMEAKLRELRQELTSPRASPR